MPLPPDVAEGVRLFNEGAYFAAHDAWEEHWGHGPAEERDLLRGLIKVAVAFHHLERGNERGFAGQVAMALPLLRDKAHVYPDLDVEAFAEDVESAAAQLRFHGRAPQELPRLRLRS